MKVLKNLILTSIIAYLAMPFGAFAQNDSIKYYLHTGFTDNGLRCFRNAVKNHIALDSDTKALVLLEWDNAYNLVRFIDTPILNLANELVAKDNFWRCVRADVYHKASGCYDYKSHMGSEYKVGDTYDLKLRDKYANLSKYYSDLENEDKKLCNQCCIINRFTDRGFRNGIKNVEHKK